MKRFGLLDQKEALPFRAGMTKHFGFLTVQKVALREHWPVLGREVLHRFLPSEDEALPYIWPSRGKRFALKERLGRRFWPLPVPIGPG